MKNIFICIILCAVGFSAIAQVPQKMSFQSVIRNDKGTLLKNTLVGIKISLLKGSASGTSVYSETHSVKTNSNGLVSLEIGGGTITKGIFANVDWAQGPFFVETKTDTSGGTNYSITGVSQLLSVPYALFAGNASKEEIKHKVGDQYGGGIIFYTYDEGNHGLIVSLEDQSKFARWGPADNAASFKKTRARADGVGAGKTNTSILIAAQGDGDGDIYAGSVCIDYVSPDDSLKFGDWYLPSKHELNLIYLNKAIVPGLAEDYYWSSTEDSSDTAWAQSMSDGMQAAATKKYTQFIRAIRSF